MKKGRRQQAGCRTRNLTLITFVSLILIAILTGASYGAQTQKIRRIAWLSSAVYHLAETLRPGTLLAFTDGLRELGWIEGLNIAIEKRFADEKFDQLPRLAAELVRDNVEVIVAPDEPAIRAAKDATTTIPIVMGTSSDAVSAGYIASLAKPGTNVTGLTARSGELTGKRLQLLKEIAPSVSRVAVLGSSSHPAWNDVEMAGRALGIKILRAPLYKPDDVIRAFNVARENRFNGLVVSDHFMATAHRYEIVTLVAQNRVPAIYHRDLFVFAGGLMSYGIDFRSVFRRAAYYVDKILKGSSPSDLPVEQPMATELVINLKTAQAIGLKLPPEVLQRADKVIR